MLIIEEHEPGLPQHRCGIDGRLQDGCDIVGGELVGQDRDGDDTVEARGVRHGAPRVGPRPRQHAPVQYESCPSAPSFSTSTAS
jgi:hypothetical protein